MLATRKDAVTMSVTDIFVIGVLAGIAGSLLSVCRSIDKLRESLESDSSKVQALLSDIRNRLGN
jgi:hypothetical protein